MDTIKSRLTIYFEEPFWVGVYERDDGEKYETAKVVFGAEPKDYEVYDYFLRNIIRLHFSPPIESIGFVEHKYNSKRIRRAAGKLLSKSGIGTKAQQALKLQQEQAISERKSCNRQKSEEEKQRNFELRQQKHKEKHKGR